MRVLVGCEESGTVRDAFVARGHDAWSCDLEPSRADPARHIVADVREALEREAWDLFIFHPPCTYLSGSGLHWYHRREGRPALTEAAVEFAKGIWDTVRCARCCMENPVGYLSRRIRPPDQIVQPFQFGENASKATCLWLRGLPLLRPTKRVSGRWVTVGTRRVERWNNQTDSGQNRLGPSDTRERDRSVTYPGIARAMAEQWG